MFGVELNCDVLVIQQNGDGLEFGHPKMYAYICFATDIFPKYDWKLR